MPKSNSRKTKFRPNMTGSASEAKQIARQIIAHREAVLARRAKAIAAYSGKMRVRARAAGLKALKAFVAPRTLGYLIAAGDSWFDYPGVHWDNGVALHDDVLERLEEAGYDVESTAHAGDAIETMAFGSSGQLVRLSKCFEKVEKQGEVPKAILLSGGGNDIAGAEFGMLINHSASPIAGWNGEVVDGVINERIGGAYRRMLNIMIELSQSYFHKALPILIHGYAHAVPDGRNFTGLPFFPGPWLQPGFNEKQFTDLQKATDMVEDILDRFNVMLKNLSREPQYREIVHYIDLRPILSNSVPNKAYQKSWANELHPTPDGFEAVAAKFAAVLGQL